MESSIPYIMDNKAADNLTMEVARCISCRYIDLVYPDNQKIAF